MLCDDDDDDDAERLLSVSGCGCSGPSAGLILVWPQCRANADVAPVQC